MHQNRAELALQLIDIDNELPVLGYLRGVSKRERQEGRTSVKTIELTGLTGSPNVIV